MSCTRTIWLIDTENVQKKWLNVVHFKTKKDKLIIFIGPEATYMSLKELQVFLAKYPVNQVEFCVSNAGKNSMDFHVVAKLGSLCTTGKKSNYIIVSADKGYDGLIQTMCSKGLSVKRIACEAVIQSAKCPDNDVEEAVVFSYFESGATFQLPCKVNKETHEIFDVTCAAMPCDDDCFSYAEVEINGKDYPVNFIDDILSENNVDDALDEFYRIQQTDEYWQPAGNKTLDDAIHECRWAILKDALMQRGHDAVADFIGTDVSSDSYERLLDETEAQMPSEEFEKFWERYI